MQASDFPLFEDEEDVEPVSAHKSPLPQVRQLPQPPPETPAQFYRMMDGLMKSRALQQGYSHLQKQSFNHFTSYEIAQIVRDARPLVYVRPLPSGYRRNGVMLAEGEEPDEDDEIVDRKEKVVIVWGEPVIGDPERPSHATDGKDHTDLLLSPHEARMRGLTYAAPWMLRGTVRKSLVLETEEDQKFHVKEADQFDPSASTLPVLKKKGFSEAADGSKVEIDSYGNEWKIDDEIYERLHMGYLPIMVGSDYCVTQSEDAARTERLGHDLELESPYDEGGYFIVGGIERFIVSQERQAPNYPYLFTKEHESWIQLRSVNDNCRRAPTTLYLMHRPAPKRAPYGGAVLQLHLGNFKNNIPLFILFQALGIHVTSGEICSTIGDDPEMVPCLLSCQHEADLELSRVKSTDEHDEEREHREPVVRDELEGEDEEDKEEPPALTPLTPKEAALRFLAKNFKKPKSRITDTIAQVQEYLTKDFLPHVGGTLDYNRQKSIYLGYITRRLLQAVLGRRAFDNKDAYFNKRVDMSGTLLGDLLRNQFESMRNGWLRLLTKKGERVREVDRYPDHHLMTKGLEFALKTGNWTTSYARGPRSTGVSQVLTRLNPTATRSDLRKVDTPSAKQARGVNGPRELHTTQWGKLDPADVPEGHECGLIKKFAQLAHVTRGFPGFLGEVREYVSTVCSGHTPADEPLPKGNIRMLINGLLIGSCTRLQMHKLIKAIQEVRRDHMQFQPDPKAKPTTNLISEMFREISIREDGDEVQIYTDAGRVSHYVLVVPGRNLLPPLMMGGPSSLSSIANRRAFEFRLHEPKLSSAIRRLWPFSDADASEFIAAAEMRKQQDGYSSDAVGSYSVRLRERVKKILKEIESLPDWQTFVDSGWIELLDGYEEDCKYTLIAMTCAHLRKEYDLFIKSSQDTRIGYLVYTHCEISPTAVLGTTAAHIPFIDRNPAPRNVFGTVMAKQAAGVYLTNYQVARLDNEVHPLHYLQRPLVATNAAEHMFFNDLPTGQNLIVALMHFGYNQEDGVVMNQSALDRGLLRTDVMHIHTETAHKSPDGFTSQQFAKPIKVRLDISGNNPVAHLEDDGLCATGDVVSTGDVIMAKQLPVPAGQIRLGSVDGFYFPPTHPCTVRNDEFGAIRQVIVTDNKDGERTVKTQILQQRIPEQGDKFCSRHGQKGVCAICLRQADMPYTKEGIVPDLIINPFGMAGRSTLGHIVEMLAGKDAAVSGTFADGTPWRNTKVEDIYKRLQANGHDGFGNEVLYDGRTGKRIEGQIFMGPCFYQRLKHQIKDKTNVRTVGPYDPQTRQPVKGRSRDGGIRFGEMERDCLMTFGAAHALRERLFFQSDKYHVWVCEDCRLIISRQVSVSGGNKGVVICKACQNSERVSKVYLPYACKLLFQELQAMCIAPRIVPGL